MKIRTISSAGGSRHNEDLIAVFDSDRFTDVLIMDGGSSVADENFIDSEIGDVAWFTRNFAELLEKAISADRSQAESVTRAIGELHALFGEKALGVSVPLYAFPVAAMTWIRITETAEHFQLNIYCLGDCKTFALQAGGRVVDLDPYINPQESVLRNEIRKLTEQGITDGAARKECLMPMLRARREFQNSSASPSVLCLKPDVRFDAREHSVRIEPGSVLVAMTDGFYRIVDTYDMYTIDELTNLCQQGNLEPIMQELRNYERARRDHAGLTVKSADDASAVVLWCQIY